MNRQFKQITAIYTRVDGGNFDTEESISHQKASLTEYAREHGLTNIRVYSDCGFSAYDETRPAFVGLENDIRHGKVSALVLFDLPRLSRDYIIISEWIETFLPRYHVSLHSIKEQITPERPIPLALPIAALFGGGR